LLRKHLGHGRLDDQAQLRVGRDNGLDVVCIEMIRVLMREEDCIEIGEAVPGIGEGPGVDEKAGGRRLNQETGVSETGDDHPWIMADQPEGGPRRAGLRNRIRPCWEWW
jgi:hypothetical protein